MRSTPQKERKGDRVSLVARRWTPGGLACLCALAGSLGLGAAPAAAAVPTQIGGESGSAPGELDVVGGVGVNQENGDVYATSRNDGRVEKFTSEGTLLAEWRGSGGGFGEAEAVAVDNSLTSLSRGDVYVVDVKRERVQKFGPNGEFLLMFGGRVNENGSNICLAGEKCVSGVEGTGNGEFTMKVHPTQGGEGKGIAVGPAGEVYVADETRVQEFSSAGAYLKTVVEAPVEREFCAGGFNAGPLAVDAGGDVYAEPPETGSRSTGCRGGGLQKYSPSGSVIQTLLPGYGKTEVGTIALDSAGDVFAEVRQPGNRVLEFNSSGVELGKFGAGEPGSFEGMAWGETIKRLYIADSGSGNSLLRLVAVPPPGALIVKGTEAAGAIEPTTANADATVNPENHATSYRVEYGLTSGYGASAPAPEGSLAASFEEDPVAVPLTKLRPATTYHYRIVATDSEGHVSAGPDQTFQTLPAVSIDLETVSAVASTSATLEGELNPLGAPASYRIEYDTTPYTPGEAPHGTVAAEGSLSAGNGNVSIGSPHLQGLKPHTVYHFRVVALDEREGVRYTVEGPDRVFTTQAIGSTLTLPDGRAWELVSPANKHGALIFRVDQNPSAIEASPDGSAITYVAGAPTEVEGSQGFLSLEQLMSRRGAGGWSTRDIGTIKDVPAGDDRVRGEYMFFTPDLSSSLVEQVNATTTLLSGEASERTPYLRSEGGCEAPQAEGGCYLPLVTSREPFADVPAGTQFGANPDNSGAPNAITAVAASPDLRHVVLGATTELIKGAPAEGLYEWTAAKPPAERLQPVSVLPNGEFVKASDVGSDIVGIGARVANGRGAVSSDGTRIFWDEGRYMRDTLKGETLEIADDERSFEFAFQFATGAITGPQRMSREFFTNDNDLYECEILEVNGKDRCNLTDLTPTPTSRLSEAPEVMWQLTGVSEDGSYVYYVANGVFAAGASRGTCDLTEGREEGFCNLYVRHNGVTTFVAQLAGADSADWAPDGTIRAHPLEKLTARTSPDGRYLAFVSHMSLTGYDNRDAVGGQADQEVFLYDASRPLSEGKPGVPDNPACVSCNPTGARPLGESTLPGWTATGVSGEATYQSRYLSDEGRMFFESNDALVSQDVNGAQDVYEFEPAGLGSCTAASPSFGTSSGGCVSLISSGSSPTESSFVDASESGNDVFFLTDEKLVPEDADTAVDLYDARVCTSAAPCPGPPVDTPECTTTDACRAAPAAQPAIFGAPSSATFAGAGNVGHATAPAPAAPPLTRAQKLARALRACRLDKRTRRRTLCERTAHRRYGAVSVRGAHRGKRSRR
ncbi:MAG: hypothetical protein FWD42_03810 [Solirubrobacterales bacterium]|nr:hypothetical protein [Solirubrobacterales bacterium]